MGNQFSEDCPSDLKQFIAADIILDLRSAYRDLHDKARDGGEWEVHMQQHGCLALRDITSRLCALQRLPATDGCPRFDGYCRSYYRLFADLDMHKRMEAYTFLLAQDQKIDLQAFLRAMTAFIGFQLPEVSSAAWWDLITKSIGGDGQSVSPSQLTRAVETNLHGLITWLQCFCAGELLGESHPLVLKGLQHMLPPLEGTSQMLTPSRIALLVLAMPQWVEVAARAHTAVSRPHQVDITRPPRGPWQLLFDLHRHGRSLASLLHRVVGYSGPTLLVLSTTAGDVLGGYIPLPWVESTEYQGNADCFLFQLHPSTGIFRAAKPKGNFFYFNATLKGKEKDYTKGLGFGGRVPDFRLRLDAELQTGTAIDFCATFAQGALARSTTFEVALLEVWGCGDHESLSRLKTYQSTISAEVEHGKKVDRRAMFGDTNWRESADAVILQLGGVQLHTVGLPDDQPERGTSGATGSSGRIVPVA